MTADEQAISDASKHFRPKVALHADPQALPSLGHKRQTRIWLLCGCALGRRPGHREHGTHNDSCVHRDQRLKTHLGQPRESETMVSPTHHPSGLAALAKQLFCQSVMNQSMRKKKLSVEMHLLEETCPGKAFSLDFLVLATPQNHSRSLKESRYSDDAPADPARPSGAGTRVSIFLPAGVISMCS